MECHIVNASDVSYVANEVASDKVWDKGFVLCDD